MAANQGQEEYIGPLPSFRLTIPFQYYILEPQLESVDMSDAALQKEYEALTPALQKVFREKEEFHHHFQTKYGLAATTEEIICYQMNKIQPPLPGTIAKKEMKGAVPTSILEAHNVDGTK